MLKFHTTSILLLLSTAAGFGQHGEACPQPRIEIPVYNEFGHRLRFKIEKLVPSQYVKQEADNPGWLARNGFRPRIEGDWVFGLPPLQEYVVTLRGPQGDQLTRKVYSFTTCVQRASQVVITGRHQGSIGDVEHDEVVGRLIGCRFIGDWWVRLVPIHGHKEPSAEGAVQRDGRFAVPGHFATRSYALVIGFEHSIVKSVAASIHLEDGKTDVGRIDLKGTCPSH